jgi:hypothetical protein
MIRFSNDLNPAMRFEWLSRFVFNNCDKWGDPWNYSAQERFVNFVPKPNLTVKRALSTILIKIILDNMNATSLEKLRNLENQVWESSTQREIIKIIDQTIQLLEEMHK